MAVEDKGLLAHVHNTPEERAKVLRLLLAHGQADLVPMVLGVTR